MIPLYLIVALHVVVFTFQQQEAFGVCPGYNRVTGTVGSQSPVGGQLRVSTAKVTVSEASQRFVSISRYGSIFHGDISTGDHPLRVVVDEGYITGNTTVSVLESFVVFVGGANVNLVNLTEGSVGALQMRFRRSEDDALSQVIVPFTIPSSTSSTSYAPMRGFIASFTTDVVSLVVAALNGGVSSGWVRVLPLLPTPSPLSQLTGARFMGWVANPPCYVGGLSVPTYVLSPLPLPQEWADILSIQTEAKSVETTSTTAIDGGGGTSTTGSSSIEKISVALPYYVDDDGASGFSTATLNMNLHRLYQNEINVRMESAIVALGLGIAAITAYIVLLILVRRDRVSIPTWMGGKRPTVDFWVNPRVNEERGEMVSSGSVAHSGTLFKRKDAFDDDGV